MKTTTQDMRPQTATDVQAEQARREAWKREHAAALAAQDDWLDRNGHPFAAIAANLPSGS